MPDDNANTESQNPFESPQTEAHELDPLTGRAGKAGFALSENMLHYLKKTSPWLRFIGIAGFISLGIMTLIAIIIGFGLGTALAEFDETGLLVFFSPGLSLTYIMMIGLYFFPILFIFRFGARIKSYIETGNETYLEDAFKNNKFLWTFIGVLAIIGISLVAALILAGAIAAIAVIAGVSSL